MITASYGFQTVTSRIAGVVLVGAATVGAAPETTFDRLRWRPLPAGSGVAVGLEPEIIRDTSLHAAMTMFTETCAALAARMRLATRVALRLLWGNAAASLAGVLRRCVWSELMTERQSATLLASFHSAAPSMDLVVSRSVDGLPTFQRRTCCLLTKAGGFGICEECSLLEPDRYTAAQRAVRRSFEAAGHPPTLTPAVGRQRTGGTAE
jgi:hypothetical protein